MSSSTISWAEIRRGMGDPLSAAMKALINKQNMFITQQEQPTTQRARGAGRSTSSHLTYKDPFTYGFSSEFKDRFFLPPMEPDGKYLTCWIPMKSLGRYIKDLSFFDNHAYMKGQPLMCNGPDDALFGGRIAIEFNNNPNRDDYLAILHNSNVSISSLATGIRIFARVKFNDVASDGGINATLFQKIDSSLANSGYSLRVGEDGSLKWFVRRSSTTYDHITPGGVVDADVIYDIGCGYNISGNATSLYVNAVLQNDTASESITFPAGDATDLRLCIGDNANAGRAQVTFYDFRIYYEYLVSLAEWNHLYTNKRSISDIPLGLVAAEGITQLEYNPPFTDGFTDGFTH